MRRGQGLASGQGGGGGASDMLVRENLLSALSRQCAEAATGLQRAQQDCQLAVRRRLRRMVQLLNPDMLPAQVDAVLAAGLSPAHLKSMVTEVSRPPFISVLYCTLLYCTALLSTSPLGSFIVM